ncbi:STAS domain-containing protein [Stackebrandtia soli]|uniref:STAS domain-containing protein n=1 Tax=Stackebrandtia soli TaxID=1892856 RepID=UPI0039ED71BB
MELTFRTQVVDSCATVHVTGEIDMYTASELREQLSALLSSGVTELTVDVGGVDFCDSTGLGVFIGILRRLREVNGSMKIIAVRHQLMKIFQLTGLHKVFDITPAEPSDG